MCENFYFIFYFISLFVLSFLVTTAKDLSISAYSFIKFITCQFLLLFQKTSFLFHWCFSTSVFFSLLCISTVIFMISFILLTLGFICSFSDLFTWYIKLFNWDFSCSLRDNCIAEKKKKRIPLRAAFSRAHRFWKVVFLFSFVSRCFLVFSLIYSLTHWFFSSMLF